MAKTIIENIQYVNNEVASAIRAYFNAVETVRKAKEDPDGLFAVLKSGISGVFVEQSGKTVRYATKVRNLNADNSAEVAVLSVTESAGTPDSEYEVVDIPGVQAELADMIGWDAVDALFARYTTVKVKKGRSGTSSHKMERLSDNKTVNAKWRT